MLKKRIYQAACIGLMLCFGWVAVAGDFEPYPGAEIDEEVTQKARELAPGKKSTVYTTSDSFEDVCAFYAERGKEIEIPGLSGQKLASGHELKAMFYVFDDASGLEDSKLWIKVQYPYIADMASQDIRDVTAIVLVEEK
jgi:hypothetical protein